MVLLRGAEHMVTYFEFMKDFALKFLRRAIRVLSFSSARHSCIQTRGKQYLYTST